MPQAALELIFLGHFMDISTEAWERPTLAVLSMNKLSGTPSTFHFEIANKLSLIAGIRHYLMSS